MSRPNYPAAPSGISPEASFHRRMVSCLKESFPVAGPGILSKMSADGVILSLAPQHPSAGIPQAPSQMSLMRVTGISGDFLQCQTWNGEFNDGYPVLGGTNILVAKMTNMRRSLPGAYVDGVTLSYDWTIDTSGMGNYRTVMDSNGNSEIQVCFERYIALAGTDNTPTNNQDVICAALITQATGVADVDATNQFWLEIKPARVWCRKYNQTPP